VQGQQGLPSREAVKEGSWKTDEGPGEAVGVSGTRSVAEGVSGTTRAAEGVSGTTSAAVVEGASVAVSVGVERAAEVLMSSSRYSRSSSSSLMLTASASTHMTESRRGRAVGAKVGNGMLVEGGVIPPGTVRIAGEVSIGEFNDKMIGLPSNIPGGTARLYVRIIPTAVKSAAIMASVS
jgi:hypothetical protein